MTTYAQPQSAQQDTPGTEVVLNPGHGEAFTAHMISATWSEDTGWSGLDMVNPAGHVFLRGNGKAATVGWPTSPKIEALRDSWFRAPNLAAQKALAEQLQLQAFEDVPYVPLGQYFIPTAYQANLTGMLQGGPVFWNIRRS